MTIHRRCAGVCSTPNVVYVTSSTLSTFDQCVERMKLGQCLSSNGWHSLFARLFTDYELVFADDALISRNRSVSGPCRPLSAFRWFVWNKSCKKLWLGPIAAVLWSTSVLSDQALIAAALVQFIWIQFLNNWEPSRNSCYSNSLDMVARHLLPLHLWLYYLLADKFAY